MMDIAGVCKTTLCELKPGDVSLTPNGAGGAENDLTGSTPPESARVTAVWNSVCWEGETESSVEVDLPLRTIHILVVDDDAMIRRMLTMALMDKGMRTSEAADGDLAVMWLTANDCDVLLTDFEMPNMNGLQILSWARKKRPNLPVILMTATLNSITKQAAIHLGASAVLEKPFGSKQLFHAISQLFQRSPHIPTVVNSTGKGTTP